jgi:UDP-perosamine 4-acetyltransferase
VVLVGIGGHARVLIEVLGLARRQVLGALTPDAALWGTEVHGVPVLGGDEVLDRLDPAGVELVNAVSSTRSLDLRAELSRRGAERGLQFARVLHPAAIISPSASLGAGVQVLAGAIVQPGCVLGQGCIVNTGAVVEHDCVLGDHVHVAPRAVLSGFVRVGARAHLGTGCVVIQGCDIGEGALVGAGAVVVRSVAANTTVYGNPARPAAGS